MKNNQSSKPNYHRRNTGPLTTMNLSLKTEHITEKQESLLSLLTNVGVKANRSNLIRVVTL